MLTTAEALVRERRLAVRIAVDLRRAEQGDSTPTSGRDRVFSVQQPLPDAVAQLNAFDPVILTGYPSAIRQLARERSAGLLRIRPGLVGTGGETVSIEERRRIAMTFGAPVVDGYGSSECLLGAVT